MVTDKKHSSGPKKEPNNNREKQSSTSEQTQQTTPVQKPVNASSASGQGEPPMNQVENLKTEMNSIQEKLTEAEQNAAKHWEALLRAKAEHDNTRKRLERDVENAHKFALERFAQDLLPVIDSLEMGINAANDVETDINKLREGSVLTLKMFADCANKFGIEAINPLGQPFNPEFHQAMSIQESTEYPPDTVMAVMQKGYTLNGRLIRPAMVFVSKGVTKQADNANTDKSQQNSSSDSPK